MINPLIDPPVTPSDLEPGRPLAASATPMRGVILLAPDGSASWANPPALEWLGADDLGALRRRWSSVASRLVRAEARPPPGPVPAVLRLGHGATARTLHCEINDVDGDDAQIVVMHCEDEHADDALLLANQAIVAPLLAGKMVHDVRGGLGEATMAVASVQAVLQSAQRDAAGADTLRVAAERLRFVLSGCARASAALDVWVGALGAPTAADDATDVDLRDVLLALASVLPLPAMMRFVRCDVTAGDESRWTRSNAGRLHAALAGLGLHLIHAATEGALLTCRFVDQDPRVHTIEMAIDACADAADEEDAFAPTPDAARAQLALLAASAAIAACGGELVGLAPDGDEGAGYRVTLPATIRAAPDSEASGTK